MNKNGISLLEIIVVTLVFSLLLIVVMLTTSSSFKESSRIDKHVQLTSDVATLLAYIRSDMERCMTDNRDSPLEITKESISVDKHKLTFKVIEDNGFSFISYEWNKDNRSILRKTANREILLCKNIVMSFEPEHMGLIQQGNEGISLSIENISAQSPKLLRTWVKLNISVEISESLMPENPPSQVYEPVIYPVKLNRLITSKWYE